MKAFYGTRFSQNMTKTPEGFLICHNVPIARTGWQEYLAREIGLDGDDIIIKVYRSPDEVFSQATIASAEGKAVTDNHPNDEVRPDNYAAYAKGHALNGRRGSGEYADYLLADLVITDPVLISEIESGKREVSCGYNCEYVEVNGHYEQRCIRMNHVAVVQSGRAGPSVAIRDSKPQKRGGTKSVKNDRNSLVGKILKLLSMDAEPEEIAAAHEMLSEKKEPAAAPPDTKDTDPAPTAAPDALAQILAALKSLQDQVNELKAGKAAEPAADSLTELEAELSDNKETGDSADEESVTVSPEELSEEKTETVAAADKASVLAAIKAVKPIIAKMPEAQRKQASDALTKELRTALGKSPVAAVDQNAYKALMAAKNTVKDSKPTAEDRENAFQAACAKRNPHQKEAK